MKSLLPAIILATAAGFALVSCDSDDSALNNPGSALIDTRLNVVEDSSFTVTGRSLDNSRVQSRTTTQLLGAINAKEYGVLTSDFAAMLFPSNDMDTVGVTAERVDSVKLQLVFEKTGFVGDSLAPIGIQAFLLNKELDYPIYSDGDPSKYYSESDLLGQSAFTAVGVSVNDTVAANAYRFAYIDLPLEMGRKLFTKFKDDPALFNDPYAFTDWFPGIYIKHSFGSGRVSRITDLRFMMYYHKVRDLTNSAGEVVKDSLTRHYAYYMAMAPELPCNSFINMKMSDQLLAQQKEGQALIVSPAGRDAEITFPILDVLKSYREKSKNSLPVMNSLLFTVPADTIFNNSGIRPPTYLLMVPSSQKEQFFADNSLPDGVTSVLGTYDSTTKTYTFSDLRGYFLKMLDKQDAGEEITSEDYTFILTPISMVMETSDYGYSTTMSGITPMVTLPTMVNLNLTKAKVKLVFTKQTFK